MKPLELLESHPALVICARPIEAVDGASLLWRHRGSFAAGVESCVVRSRGQMDYRVRGCAAKEPRRSDQGLIGVCGRKRRVCLVVALTTG